MFNALGRLSPERFYLFFSLFYFKKKFHLLLQIEIKKTRNQWLLSHCQPSTLSCFDTKAAEHYFQKLDETAFENYLSSFKNASEWFENEFIFIRKQIFVQLFKKNINFFLFWFFILFAICFGLLVTSQENTYTIWEQLKGWFAFLLKRVG
jgi:hypothetical protein